MFSCMFVVECVLQPGTKIAGDIIIECNEKVKELDSHIKILTLHIKENEDYIAKQDKYINDLEKYAKDNDSQSWFSRNKLLFGFIGGILLTTGLVVGIGQIVK